MTSEQNSEPVNEPAAEESAEKPSFFGRVIALFNNSPSGELVNLGPTPLELTSDVRIAWENGPFRITLGKSELEFHPDHSITGVDDIANREWIIHIGPAFYEGACGFKRIAPGNSLVLGRSDDIQKKIFEFGKSVAGRHVNVINHKGELTIQPLDTEMHTSLSAMDPLATMAAARLGNLFRLPDILDHPLSDFDDEEALEVYRKVNAILAKEVYREKDKKGAPGGIIKFPDDMTVVIMGDIHTRIDNILRVLTEGGLLAALQRGNACLVFLGDLVHNETDGEYDEMDSSIFILDTFAMLKLRFPKNVFYIRGNHEAFIPEIGKGGVPQGILLRKHLKKRRGKEFVTEIEKLFDSLAFIVQGNEFAACHGAPVRSKVTQNTLVNIQRYPGIMNELVWNRLRTARRPGGYAKGSVKRFRQTLGLSKHSPLICAHTPLSPDETLWMDAGEITGHHIIFSAHAHRVAAMLMHQGQAIPLEYIPEPSLAFLKETPETPETPGDPPESPPDTETAPDS